MNTLTLVILGAALMAPPVPGALNPQVTQANISTTICRPGWTKTIRPPVTYTDALKRTLMQTGHLPGTPADYELDHLVPLELGGHPTSRLNLWMQPLAEARMKDKWETAYNKAVCGGKLTLAAAQQKIKDPRNWH